MFITSQFYEEDLKWKMEKKYFYWFYLGLSEVISIISYPIFSFMILFFFKKAIRENLQDVIVTPTGRVHESGHPARAACVWIRSSGKRGNHPADVALQARNPERGGG